MRIKQPQIKQQIHWTVYSLFSPIEGVGVGAGSFCFTVSAGTFGLVGSLPFFRLMHWDRTVVSSSTYWGLNNPKPVFFIRVKSSLTFLWGSSFSERVCRGKRGQNDRTCSFDHMFSMCSAPCLLPEGTDLVMRLTYVVSWANRKGLTETLRGRFVYS